MPDSTSLVILLILASLAAGAVNALAGGGTLLTFPPLAAVMTKVLANGTSTVALLPGSVAGAWGYRRELRDVGRWPMLLIVPSLAGGLLGALLVTRFPPEYFEIAVPWLILLAAILFLLQPTILRLTMHWRPRQPHDSERNATLVHAGLWIGQFLIAIYGGYFGAGIGILMLSALGFMGIGNIHHMNAVKTVLAAVINLAAVAVFVFDDKVVWPVAGIMAVGAIIGGYLGAHYGRRLPRAFVRWLVIAIGFGLAAKYFWEQLT